MRCSSISDKVALSLLLATLSLSAFANRMAIPHAEQLKYNVYFHVGFIWKKSAVVALTSKPIIHHGKPGLQLHLSTITTPFFDKFMKMRDTMVCITSPSIQPFVFSRITHQEAIYSNEKALYLYKSGQTTTQVQKETNRKVIKNTIRFHSGIQVFDMLSIFYYLRTMNMNLMVKNHTLRYIIVSGTNPYMIRINYKGIENIETPKVKKLITHKISFIFEYMINKKIQRNELLIWLSADGKNRPMMMTTQLPVGAMKAYYEGVE